MCSRCRPLGCSVQKHTRAEYAFVRKVYTSYALNLDRSRSVAERINRFARVRSSKPTSYYRTCSVQENLELLLFQCNDHQKNALTATLQVATPDRGGRHLSLALVRRQFDITSCSCFMRVQSWSTRRHMHRRRNLVFAQIRRSTVLRNFAAGTKNKSKK